jgi:glycosyltransferase involved in cell wall biosynthesis
MKEISVVAPVFNEESLIVEFISQVTRVLETISNDYELILVDDGSSDSSWHAIKMAAQKNEKIKAIKFSRNFGHHYAITAGIHRSLSRWTVVMDSDLQDRPEVIIELYNKAIEGFDVVFVTRKNRPEALWYLLIQKIFYKILNITSGLKFNSSQANFSIINFRVVEAFRIFNEYSRFYGSTIKWLGFETTEIKANHGVRFSGKPSYTIKSRIKLAFDISLAFSDRPLKFAIFESFVSILLIIIYGIINQIENFTTDNFRVFIFIICGLIFNIVGIFGVYLLSIFKEVKNRPLYIISDEIN